MRLVLLSILICVISACMLSDAEAGRKKRRMRRVKASPVQKVTPVQKNLVTPIQKNRVTSAQKNTCASGKCTVRRRGLRNR